MFYVVLSFYVTISEDDIQNSPQLLQHNDLLSITRSIYKYNIPPTLPEAVVMNEVNQCHYVILPKTHIPSYSLPTNHCYQNVVYSHTTHANVSCFH